MIHLVRIDCAQTLVLDEANFPALASPGKPASNPSPPPSARGAPAATAVKPVVPGRPASPISPLGTGEALLPPRTA